MTVALRRPMTQAEFFEWAQAQEGRYEFDGFQPVAMTGGSGNHARIVGNIAFQLRRHLGEDSPCEVLTSDAGVQTARDAVRYPDALVTCTRFDGRDRLIPNSVVVFEVVSPSSVREDRILKPEEYAGVGSIKRYVLVEQSVVGLTVLWRGEQEPWHFQTLKAGETLALPEIGVEVPVDSLYARVTFDEASSEAVPPGAGPGGG